MKQWYQTQVVPAVLNKEMGATSMRVLRGEVVAPAKGVVLELGSGPGYNFEFYSDIEKLYALEPSEPLRNISRARINSSLKTEFITVGAENIPLPDASVDTAVSTWTLCSVKDLTKVLSEVRRVLKPDGTFRFVEHGMSPSDVIRWMQYIATATTKHFTGNCHYDRDFLSAIEAAGFVIEEMRHPKEKMKPLIYNYQGIAKKRI